MSRNLPQGFYAATAQPRPPTQPLFGRNACDICVVGGGYTGLSAALHLARAGERTILLEAEQVGFAASGRNGGQIHTGFRKDQALLERWLGEKHARDLWAIAEDAKALVSELIAENGIACELKRGLVIAAHDTSALRGLEVDAEHLQARYDFAVDILDRDEIASGLGTENYPGGTLDLSGGHLHPLKFARGLASAAENAGTTIFEQSRVRAIEQRRDSVVLNTDAGSVEAGSVLLACDAFSADVAPELACFIGHVESFIVATGPLDPDMLIVPSDVAVADTRHVLDYYRKSADNRLLFAGRESYFTPPKDIARLVRPRMLRVFPALKNIDIEYAWRGTVGITRSRMPHFGKIGPRIFFGHGYSGHGVALSVIGGKILAEAAQGQRERFEILARVPARPFPGGASLRKPMITAGLIWYKLMDAF